MKTCSRCKVEKPLELFGSKGVGVKKSRCQPCDYQHIKEKRPQRIVRANLRKEAAKKLNPILRDKYNARKAARRKYGSAGSHKCAVLSCLLQASDLHHDDYSDRCGVIPLCRAHHRRLHKAIYKP